MKKWIRKMDTSLQRLGIAWLVILCLSFTFSACSTKGESTIDSNGTPPVIEEAPPQGLMQGQEKEEPLRYTSGPFEGQPMPTYIKGSYTFANISNFYDIPLNDLVEAFMIPIAQAETIKSGDLKKLYQELFSIDKELGNSSVVMFVSLYKGMPYEPHEPTFLLHPAIAILDTLGMLDLLSKEELQYIRDHTIQLDEIGNVHWDVIEDTSEDHKEGSTPKINSKTTFQDLVDAGILEELILEVIGTTTMPALDLVVRDYCVLNKIQFSYVREELTPYFNP